MPGAWRVDEAPGAGVDADMIDRTPCTDTKKNQVTRNKLGKRNGARGALLRGRSTGNRQPGALMNVQSQAAAVEAALVGSPKVVRRPDERGGHGRDDGTLIGWRR